MIGDKIHGDYMSDCRSETEEYAFGARGEVAGINSEKTSLDGVKSSLICRNIGSGFSGGLSSQITRFIYVAHAALLNPCWKLAGFK